MNQLSPRFLALPAIAFAVIVGLAQAQSPAGSTGLEATTVMRAGTCAAPTKAIDAACTLADRGTTILR